MIRPYPQGGQIRCDTESIASLALRKTAEMRKQVLPEAADVIINSSCMDDIIDSMAGVEGARVLTKNISDILKMGDFHIKEWGISFESTDASIKLQMFEPGSKSEKVLDISLHVNGAVHLDVTIDYSSDAFLMVFRRFSSLRGYPNIIYSDSGSQIAGASNVLKLISKEYDWNKIMEFGIDKGIEWKFSPDDEWLRSR